MFRTVLRWWLASFALAAMTIPAAAQEVEPLPVPVSPMESFEVLTQAGANGDVAQYKALLTGLSLERFNFAEAFIAFENKARTEFPEAGIPVPTPMSQRLVNAYDDQFSVTSMKPDGNGGFYLNVLRGTGTGYEEIWAAVPHNGGWGFILPKKGLVVQGTPNEVTLTTYTPAEYATALAQTQEDLVFINWLTSRLGNDPTLTFDDLQKEIEDYKLSTLSDKKRPQPGPGGGTKVRGSGHYPLTRDCRVFVSNNTVAGDASDISWDLPWFSRSTIHEGIRNWNDVCTHLNGVANNSLQSIVLSGHGGNGGISTRGGAGNWLTAANLTPAIAAKIRSKLKPGAPIIILGCSQATGANGPRLQALANAVGRPVIGNSGAVSGGANGAGCWYRFDPQ